MRTTTRRRVRLALAAVLLGLFVYLRFFAGPRPLQGAWERGEILWQTIRSLVAPRCCDGRDCCCGRRYPIASDLQTIRAQLELHKMQHGGQYPADLVKALTTSDGTYGPYMTEFPANPNVPGPNSAKVDLTAPGGSTAGWFYDPKTGLVKPDNDEDLGL